jgi:hypothetical protein
MATRKRKVGSHATELVKKAREAALTAVQIYNNPQIDFKSELFIVTSVSSRSSDGAQFSKERPAATLVRRFSFTLTAQGDHWNANSSRTRRDAFCHECAPRPGGEPGIYEEQVAQWVGEKSFFRDFVYRNAKGKKNGDQLVDGIVLFGDVMFLIEVKAQIGTAKRDDWVETV